ncbi:restriction endonuclease subunit M [Actinomadura sp. CNU-125]|uniref:type I restriction-modification system subunit M n=1 Tax=Actinomadura sp. CNU-125 TaxID=1904961 RepID=UPI00095938BB|nr:type I restriction-modification system subunit M [Actinomadura sp. CNU-125]OLT36517.1 restriction endonuclease subunit M [Actinomadura sp. CNU-125]
MTGDDLKDILWRSADKLRGSMDAAQYKDFVLGLVFLKFASGSGAFDVPEPAHWDALRTSGDAGDVGGALDAAMDALMAANPSLAGALPKIFGGADARRLAELVDLIDGARFDTARFDGTGDVLGEIYEYFLERFARAEGKRGGEFYTPSSVVKLLVEILEPYKGRVYDPCCGSGGMFVQAEKFVLSHRGRRDDIAVFGQEANERTWRLARMNLAVHGITGDLGRADTFHADAHPDLRADFVLANPPFNMSDWYRRADDPRWRFGVPPAGNANFAWIQHILAKLAPTGSAGVVMANGSMSSAQKGEGEIRTALVEADLVSCMVALPPQLFRTTQIPACLWFFAKDKGARSGHVLFVDARDMGTLVDRTERVLTSSDIDRITGAHRAWRDGSHVDEPGFARSVPLAAIREHGHVLAPGRYVGTPAAAPGESAEPAADRIERLTKELLACLDESARVDAIVRSRLDGAPDG